VTWTAPEAPRADPPLIAAERSALQGWLDYHRATLLTKCAGLTAGQLVLRAVEPSPLSLLGLVRHMTDVERWWFRSFAGQQTDLAPVYWKEGEHRDFDLADAANAESDMAAFAAECEASDQAVARLALSDTFVHPETSEDFRIDLRWIYLHMIEEYARHNGHADFLRERIDGVTGD
jgi:uncharacterized damage-inducible protein DinB